MKKGSHHTIESLEKIREGTLGKPKPKPSGFRTSTTFGNLPIEKHKEISKRGRAKSSGFKGKHHKEDSNQRNREKHLGISFSGWTKSDESKRKQSQTRLQKFRDGTLTIWNKGIPPTEIALKNWLRSCGLKPNKKETKLNNLLTSNLPNEYQINVRADVMTLGGKIPDFVNVNGKKKLIELYGDFWHKNNDPEDRINYFKQFGWDTLVIWEHELDEPNILAKITNFTDKEG